MITKGLLISCAGEVASTRGRLLEVQKCSEINPKVKNFLNKAISALRVAEASITHLLELMSYEKTKNS